jgi:hypothetical protein
MGQVESEVHRMITYANVDTVISEHTVDCTRLDRVSDIRAGSVALDKCGLGRIQPRTSIHLPHQRLLRPGLRLHQTGSVAVAVSSACANDGPDRIAVVNGVIQALDVDRSDALSTGKPVGGGIEALGATVRSCDDKSAPAGSSDKEVVDNILAKKYASKVHRKVMSAMAE